MNHMQGGVVVASSKPWNKDYFEKETKNRSDDWLYVTNPEELNHAVSKIQPRYIFFLHWNWRVPREIWSCIECVCFHMTDLPYGRGGSPLQNLIMAGLDETKISAFRMVEEMDAGPVYAKRRLSLEGRAEDIYRRAAGISWRLIDWIIENEPAPKPQNGDVTCFSRRRPQQSKLPKDGNLESIYDHIRMLDAASYPLAFVEYGEFRLEFSDAEFHEDAVHARVVLRRSDRGGLEE